jgi:16S rRNA (uracil1498-N3)-methyltransferase
VLRRFWVEPSDIKETEVTFRGDSFHHLIRVSRKSVGDRVEVLSGAERAVVVEIADVQRETALGRIVGHRDLPKLSLPRINLAVAFPKPATFEVIIEKAVELGIHRVRPLLNDYSFARTLEAFPAHKKDRWNKIIKSATEQSGRASLLELEGPQTLTDFLSTTNPTSERLCLFFYEGPSALDVRSALASIPSGIKDIWAVVGSEGGFSAAEVQTMDRIGMKPITLGEQILRVETACVSILSILKYQFVSISA